MSNHTDVLTEVTEELIGTWDAAEDHGETPLTAALYELQELADSLGSGTSRRVQRLLRTVLEGSMNTAVEMLMSESGDEAFKLLSNYRTKP